MYFFFSSSSFSSQSNQLHKTTHMQSVDNLSYTLPVGWQISDKYKEARSQKEYSIKKKIRSHSILMCCKFINVFLKIWIYLLLSEKGTWNIVTRRDARVAQLDSGFSLFNGRGWHQVLWRFLFFWKELLCALCWAFWLKKKVVNL